MIRENHNVIVEDRKKLTLTGIKDVVSFDEETIVLEASLGRLVIKGSGLHILSFVTDTGDLIGEDFKIAKPKRNEILAVLTTGAYNYSMASNYNRIPRPAVVMLKDKTDYLAVKRETLEDICRLDV